MTIAMHCNLRPPDVVPVVLSFNYEAHNAPAYNFNNLQPMRIHSAPAYRISAKSDNPRLCY